VKQTEIDPLKISQHRMLLHGKAERQKETSYGTSSVKERERDEELLTPIMRIQIFFVVLAKAEELTVDGLTSFFLTTVTKQSLEENSPVTNDDPEQNS
jgi:hypothetical protein